jgi:murein DD-endopeptidase MepM/ murein hydrolase activator NlpD
MISSYVRMTVKVSNYNALRHEVELLRQRYQTLQRETKEKDHQLASFQTLASEVQVAFGIKEKLEGPPDISGEGALVPSVRQSFEEYSFLRNVANMSIIQRAYVRRWQTRTEPSLWPVEGRLMSFFGNRTDPFSGEGAWHTGIDVSVPTGTPVSVTADGIVVRAEWSTGYGKLVVVDHGHGVQTWYAHLSRFEVVPGQEVRAGQTIALSGGTGRATSPHLHYEVRMGGNPINPRKFMTSTVAQTQSKRRDFPF